MDMKKLVQYENEFGINSSSSGHSTSRKCRPIVKYSSPEIPMWSWNNHQEPLLNTTCHVRVLATMISTYVSSQSGHAGKRVVFDEEHATVFQVSKRALPLTVAAVCKKHKATLHLKTHQHKCTLHHLPLVTQWYCSPSLSCWHRLHRGPLDSALDWSGDRLTNRRPHTVQLGHTTVDHRLAAQLKLVAADVAPCVVVCAPSCAWRRRLLYLRNNKQSNSTQ
jgi:hypothetical protein